MQQEVVKLTEEEALVLLDEMDDVVYLTKTPVYGDTGICLNYKIVKKKEKTHKKRAVALFKLLKKQKVTTDISLAKEEGKLTIQGGSLTVTFDVNEKNKKKKQLSCLSEADASYTNTKQDNVVSVLSKLFCLSESYVNCGSFYWGVWNNKTYIMDASFMFDITDNIYKQMLCESSMVRELKQHSQYDCSISLPDLMFHGDSHYVPTTIELDISILSIMSKLKHDGLTKELSKLDYIADAQGFTVRVKKTKEVIWSYVKQTGLKQTYALDMKMFTRFVKAISDKKTTTIRFNIYESVLVAPGVSRLSYSSMMVVDNKYLTIFGHVVKNP